MTHVYASPTAHNYSLIMQKAAYISNINPQRRAHSLQHIYADGLVPGHLTVGALTDPRQVDDVAGAVSASL